MNPQPAPYTNQPFVYPNGISMAAVAPRVPRAFWEHFSQYSDAQRILEALKGAPLIDASAPGQQLQTPLKIGASSLQIIDGIAAGIDIMFVEEEPFDPKQPIPENYVTTWTVQGTIVVDGETFVVDEYVGDLVKRFAQPEGVDYSAQLPTQVLKLMLLPNVTGTVIGTAEATYKAA